jgi:hypothetical protein
MSQIDVYEATKNQGSISSGSNILGLKLIITMIIKMINCLIWYDERMGNALLWFSDVHNMVENAFQGSP